MIEVERVGSILEVRLANPPVNAMGAPVRRAVLEAIVQAEVDPAVVAVVITGKGGLFSGGADITEFESPAMRDHFLPDLVDRIEQSSKPVIAAISGTCFGGGLETVLSCHYRIADATARFSLPEVKLGLLPGGGGTQRLPRLVGAAAALDIMTSGRALGAKEALALGLVDQLAEGDPVAAAHALVASGVPALRRSCDLPAPADQAEAVSAARSRLKPEALSTAPARIADCVAVIGTDFQAGRAVEAELFDGLRATEASRALRHAFFGERKVARIPGLAKDVAPRSIGSVGIVGGGLMGTGIAIALLGAGLSVVIVELRDEARDKAGGCIRKTILRDVEKGRITQERADARLAALSLAPSLEALDQVDLVIEAVFEDLGVKEQVFTALDRITRPDAILASNTSTLDLDKIAAFVADPSRVVGLHFFSPANIMRLLEVVRGAKTALAVLASAMAFAKRIGKIGVVSGVCDGFIGNRMFEEYLRQAYFLLEEGALPQQIDGAMERWGMAMGPLRVLDLAGQDIGWAIRQRRAVEQPDRPYSQICDRIYALGRYGQKTGKGMYNYADGRTAQPDPEIERLIIDYSAEIGVERRVISDEEIVERCLYALINEGARIVGEGIAYRPVDVDMIYLNGYGFARERGGPLFQADEIGLAKVLERLCALAKGRNGWSWMPAPLLEQLVVQAKLFEGLNG
ncbi:MAG: 3-hydroxyacyl-CoA dehydrogenase NAD-binding domain-containing protein [Alphaproteobacteria bacterium]|nr:3-hydroxyacyl-CoA dehydrogenase NAD-binding domain-containing protein [Alphaproteobacteria bacterium]